jgi:hypothetical protein
MPHQLWYFHRTDYEDQFLIVSVAKQLALDAQTDRDTPRSAVMWSRHGHAHQRWRLRPTDEGAAYFLLLQVSNRAGRPIFQAGHAGSIPVIRSQFSAAQRYFSILFRSYIPGGDPFVPQKCHKGIWGSFLQLRGPQATPQGAFSFPAATRRDVTRPRRTRHDQDGKGLTGHCPQPGPGSWVWRRALTAVMRPGGPAASRRWRTRW